MHPIVERHNDHYLSKTIAYIRASTDKQDLNKETIRDLRVRQEKGPQN